MVTTFCFLCFVGGLEGLVTGAACDRRKERDDYFQSLATASISSIINTFVLYSNSRRSITYPTLIQTNNLSARPECSGHFVSLSTSLSWSC